MSNNSPNGQIPQGTVLMVTNPVLQQHQVVTRPGQQPVMMVLQPHQQVYYVQQQIPQQVYQPVMVPQTQQQVQPQPQPQAIAATSAVANPVASDSKQLEPVNPGNISPEFELHPSPPQVANDNVMQIPPKPPKPEKPNPVGTSDFWHYDDFELNEYETWAATSCRCCYHCCGCCVVPGTLDHCFCCFPVNCCACCYYTNQQDPGNHCWTTICYIPCNMICGPAYCMYHCCQVTCCGNPRHRYNRTINWNHLAEGQDFPYCDINRTECYKVPFFILFCLCETCANATD